MAGRLDLRQYVAQVVENLVVCETNNAKAALGQRLLALTIWFNLLQMDVTVNFDDKAGGVTVKIDDEAIDHLLPSKVKSV